MQAGLLYKRQYSHFASLVCTGGRTESCRGYCSRKTTSQALEYQPPSTGPVLSQRNDAEVRRNCSTAMPHTPSTVTGINGLVLSSCLNSWGTSKRGLHHHSITEYIKDFGHGRVPPAQRPETLSSCSQSSKGLIFNSPNDTSMIYFPTAHPLAGLFAQALGKDLCLPPQLSGRWAPQRTHFHL